MTKAFEVEDLYMYFGDVHALDGVTLSAAQGKVFGLLGPNGAGKTTLIRILSTLLEYEKGSAKVLGIDVKQHPEQVREVIGLAGQYAALDEYLTGYENVYMTARLYGLGKTEAKSRTSTLLESLGLTKAANRPVRTYSGGMRRRLDLGASLVGHPKILYLDEPTTGLDPKTRIDLWGVIHDLVKEGTTILLTTQYMDEADELADQIAVVNEGKVIAEGTSSQLKTKLGGDIIEFEIAKASDSQQAIAAVAKFAKVPPTFDKENLRVRVPVKDGSATLMTIVQALSQTKLTITDLSFHRPSLDDVFLSLTGNKAESKVVETKKGHRN